LALAATTGCAQLAGIDETSGLVPPDRVSLQVSRLSVGATVMITAQDLSANTASFLVPDDSVAEGFTRVPAELTDVDLWTAEIPTGMPVVQFDLPDVSVAQQRMLQLPSRNLLARHPVYEHLSPMPAPMGATLSVSATLPTPYGTGQSFQFFSVGTWNSRGFSAAELPLVDMGEVALGPITFPWASTSKITARPHEKITAADAVLMLRYTGNALSGVMEAAPFEQSASDTVMGVMTAVPAAQMLTARISPSTVAARYSPLRPAMGVPTMSWNLAAAPGVDHGLTNGPVLNSAAVAAAAPGMLTVPYGNPFIAKGWRTVFLWATTATRTYVPVGQMLPITLRAELFTYTEPTDGVEMTLPSGLPELIAIDGLPLSTDGLEIPKPTRTVTVSFIAAGTNTSYNVQLFELVPNMGNTALEYKPVIVAYGLTKELTLPPEVFVPGKYYTLRAVAQAGGYVNAMEGDFATRTLPISTGYHDSGVFTVKP